MVIPPNYYQMPSRRVSSMLAASLSLFFYRQRFLPSAATKAKIILPSAAENLKRNPDGKNAK
jgi:hypothetical protein